MKKLLIPTDFSANATHAAAYGYALAKQLNADVMLCNAFIGPANVPQTGIVTWPMDDYDTAIKASADELKKLKGNLESKYHSGYKPIISLVNEMGSLSKVIGDTIDGHNVDLIIMGAHCSSYLSTVLLGNHSKTMIDEAAGPLLLVPLVAAIKPIKKIAYASDFTKPENDLLSIYKLIPFAKQLHAEILLTHVIEGTHQSSTFKTWLDNILTELSNNADYPNIYYRIVKSREPEIGIDWLCEHGQIDMLVMRHRKHNFLHNLLYGSYTQKVAGHITIPLLIFNE